jgi:hypothetical protein
LTAKNLRAAFVISRVPGAKKRTQQALAKPVELATLLFDSLFNILERKIESSMPSFCRLSAYPA